MLTVDGRKDWDRGWWWLSAKDRVVASDLDRRGIQNRPQRAGDRAARKLSHPVGRRAPSAPVDPTGATRPTLSPRRIERLDGRIGVKIHSLL